MPGRWRGRGGFNAGQVARPGRLQRRAGGAAGIDLVCLGTGNLSL